MTYNTIRPFSTKTAFSPGAYTGYNPFSLFFGDHVNGPSAAPVSVLTDDSPSSFVGDLSDMSLAAPMSLWDQMKTKDFWTGSFNPTTGERTMGMGGLALGAGSALVNGWLGMKQYGLQKAQFDFQRDAFAKNWDAQRKTTNAQLQDRQQARLASREGASSNPYQSVGDYMKQYGVA